MFFCRSTFLAAPRFYSVENNKSNLKLPQLDASRCSRFGKLQLRRLRLGRTSEFSGADAEVGSKSPTKACGESFGCGNGPGCYNVSKGFAGVVSSDLILQAYRSLRRQGRREAVAGAAGKTVGRGVRPSSATRILPYWSSKRKLLTRRNHTINPYLMPSDDEELFGPDGRCGDGETLRKTDRTKFQIRNRSEKRI